MKIKEVRAKFAIVFIAVLFSNCQKFDKCEGIICFTPPPGFYIEVVDKDLGENLYASDNLQEGNISLLNENLEAVEVAFINEGNYKLIDVSKIGWIMGAHKYYLKLSDNIEIEIEIEMQEKNEDCCTFFEVVNFQISDYEFEISQYSEIIKVKV